MAVYNDIPEYRAWAAMKNKHPFAYIPRWNSYQEFIFDMGEKPSRLHVLKRLDSSQPFSKDNCEWHLPPETIDYSMRSTREYRIYQGMLQRCLNPRNKDFKNYGGRGITIETRWLRSFYAFYLDMGPCPDGHSIEREDVNKGYSADNCKWASTDTQANNKRTTHRVGNLSLKQFCDKHSLDYGLTHKRLSRGWSIERCMTE